MKLGGWEIRGVRIKACILKLALAFSVFSLLVGSCSPGGSFDGKLRKIAKPYTFSTFQWEVVTAGREIKQAVTEREQVEASEVAAVENYFAANARINHLISEINAIKNGYQTGDLITLQGELDNLVKEKEGKEGTVEKIIERQIRDTLSREGVYNPLYKYLKLKPGFPPVNFELAKPPNILVISLKDRITRLREIMLVPEITVEEMETIEAACDELGVSSLVVETGGIATYPAFVDNNGDLRFTLDAVAEEWLHQYLAFRPLGFLYNLDLMGIRRNYEIATINETVASTLGKEIGALILKEYYPDSIKPAKTPESATGFNFDKEMQRIRITVDSLLADGEVKAAEDFMEARRQYLASNGYYIRKLNQAYFAFHGCYADSGTSVDPIGTEVKELRSKSPSLRDFLDVASALKSRSDLKKVLSNTRK